MCVFQDGGSHVSARIFVIATTEKKIENRQHKPIVVEFYTRDSEPSLSRRNACLSRVNEVGRLLIQ